MRFNLRHSAPHNMNLSDPGPKAPYIGPVMFTEDQLHYLEEILGCHLTGLPDSVDVLVLTTPLDPSGHELLSKILSSVQLRDYHHVEMDSVRLSEFPSGLRARHVLAFTNQTLGKHLLGDATWWVLPPMEKMLGSGDEVVAQKKQAWNWLQQFTKEHSS